MAFEGRLSIEEACFLQGFEERGLRLFITQRRVLQMDQLLSKEVLCELAVAR